MTRRLGRAAVMMVPLAWLLAACSLMEPSQPTPQLSARQAAAQSLQHTPTQPSALQKAGDNQKAPLEPKVEIYPGSGSLLGVVSQHHAEAKTDSQGDITLNFVAADIRDVAKSILGDYLKLNYEIADNVRGKITIQTSKPLARSQVLPALEQALQLNGMVLVHSDNLYKVVPLADAKGATGLLAPRDYRKPGYGIEIVPVHYIGAEEMQKLLQPLAPTQAIVHVDTKRNILIVEGTEEERHIIVDDVALFDTDWLAGMSYALYTPNYIDSQELTKELKQILGGMTSPIATVV